MLPAQGRLADPDGAKRHLTSKVLPQLDEFVSSPAFEVFSRAGFDKRLVHAAKSDGRINLVTPADLLAQQVRSLLPRRG